MCFPRMLVALVAISGLTLSHAQAQCTVQQGLITITLDKIDNNLFEYTWTALNEDNGNGNRLQDAYFEIAAADTASTATTVAGWTKTIETVDGTWTALRFAHASGPRICSGGGSCGSPTETYMYTLDQMVSSVRIRTVQANGHTEDFTFDSSISGCESLPIELASFTGVLDNGFPVLNWETASEENAAGFEIQRRELGEYVDVAFVPAAGTASQGHQYRFEDSRRADGPLAYRLKMLDVDGTFEYSSLVELAPPPAAALVLSPAFPNPFDAATSFDVAVARERNVRVDVYDATGRRVATPFAGRITENIPQRVSLEGASLAPGVYLVRVSGDQFSASRTITLVR